MPISHVENIDCNLYMKTIPDKFFDLACVDPEYGIGIGSMNYTPSGAVRTHGHSATNRKDYRKKGEWDNKRPDKSYFDELFRISKHQIIWGGNYFSDILPVMKSYIIWDKRGDEKYTNDFSDCELAWVDSGVARVFRFLYNGMIQKDMKNKDYRFHPTQKPIEIYKWVLKRYAKPGYKIFDSHLGSGSHRIASYQLGFDFYACENDLEMFSKSCSWFDAVIHKKDNGIYEPKEATETGQQLIF
jgi:site-specific DNA-methyltransferase (adenine-specific)